MEINQCFENTLDIFEASVDNEKPSFAQYVPELFFYMDSINQNTLWVKGLTTIAGGYRTFNKFSKADSILQIALKHCTTEEQLFKVNIDWANIKQRMGQPKQSLRILDTLLNQLGPTHPLIEQPSFYMIRGVSAKDYGNTADAMRDFIKGKELSKGIPAHKHFYELAELYLSQTYLYLKSDDSLQEFYQETRRKAHKEGNYLRELFTSYSIILGTLTLEEFEQTIIEGHRAIQLKNKHNVSTAFGYIYACMGEGFIGLNQLDSASYYIEKGISFSRQSKEYKELADNLVIKTQLLITQGKYREAKPIAKEALALREQHDESLLNSYAIIQENLGNYKSAYQALRTNWDNGERKKIVDESRKIASILVEERLKMEKNQQQQQFQNQIKSQKLWGAIGLLTLFVLTIASFLYMQMKNTKKLRHLNNSLNQRNQALEQFAHITSHDLKEPVRNISSFADLLMRKSKTNKYDDDEKEYISFIQSSAKHLYRLIEAIKNFTEVSFKKYDVEEINIKEVFQIARQNLSQLINETNSSLEFHNPESIDLVQFPKELLILTLQNLIQNGIKYNHSDAPKIEVTVLELNQEIIFKVSDDGIGIDKKFHDQIFIPFKTLQNKFQVQSSGLGLTICKNIIENHGGKIWLESDGNLGSNFYFSLG